MVVLAALFLLTKKKIYNIPRNILPRVGIEATTVAESMVEYGREDVICLSNILSPSPYYNPHYALRPNFSRARRQNADWLCVWPRFGIIESTVLFSGHPNIGLKHLIVYNVEPFELLDSLPTARCVRDTA